MSYDLDTLNQAWFIACEECMEIQSDNIGNEPMFRYILSYCNNYALALLREAAKELNERRNADAAKQR